MVAMLVLFGVVVALMVALGVLAERRHQAPFTDMGAQELQEFTRPPAHATAGYGMRDDRPVKSGNGELATVFLPG